MNGIIRSPPMTRPFSSPTKAPTVIVRPAATKAECPWTSAVAPTTLVNATTEPTLRSIPPLTMIIVIPSVPIATITVWVKMILKLSPLRKNGRTVGLSENKPMTSNKPRNGPRILRRRREAVGWFDATFSAPLFQIFVQRRIQQILDFRSLHVLGRHQDHARVYPLFDLFASQMLHRRHHSQITHQ